MFANGLFSSGQPSSLPRRESPLEEDRWKQEVSGIWVPRILRTQHPHDSQQDTEGSASSLPSLHDDREWIEFISRQIEFSRSWRRLARMLPRRKKPEISQARQQELLEEFSEFVLKPVESDKRWNRYWTEQGWPWRKKPEISQAHQQELAERRHLPEDSKQGIYPFKGMTLTRADIEWLLVTHDGGRGPVDWSDESQRGREGLDLRGAVLEGVDLSELPLARLRGSVSLLEESILTEEQIIHACLSLKRAYLRGVHLEGANLVYVHLGEALLLDAHLEGANLLGAYLKRAYLPEAHLEGAILWEAHLERANLFNVHLEKAQLSHAYLGRTDLRGTHLDGADLPGVTRVDPNGVGPSLADVHWGEINLPLVDWSQVQKLGDEDTACQKITVAGKQKDRLVRRREYQDAHRANHQLAVILQNQGLIDDASQFAYRAKCLKRIFLWYELLLAKGMRQQLRISGAWLFSWVLFLLAGYGYRLWRCALWYAGIVLLFALLYFWLDPVHIPWWAALSESVNVFHGRGATPNIAQLAHPVRFLLLTVVEAIVGLVIEVIFVATVIQRLFGK